jgi:cytidylate kinase
MPEAEGPEGRADAAGGQDDAEAAGGPVELLVDAQRHEDLGGAEEEQQRDGGHDQRRPQPGLAAHERRGLTDLHAQRVRVAVAHRDAGAHDREAADGHGEGGRVDQQRAAGGDERHDRAAERRTRQAQRDRPQRRRQRVGLDERVLGDQLRDDRAHRGAAQPFAGAEDEAQQHHVPDLEDAAERQRAGEADGHEPEGVGHQQLAALVVAVGEHAAEQQEAHHPQRPRQPDERQRRRAATEVQHRKRERYEVDAVAEHRHQRAGPEQPEVSLPQRPDKAHSNYGECHTGSMPPTLPRVLVAIDGPAGAGKSTVARAVARALSFTYLDTGAMYRCAALAAERDADRDPSTLLIAFDGDRVLLDGEDVTAAIRTPEVSRKASVVANDPKVREALVAQQRALIAAGDYVAEGRDIATVVAPGAEVKVFLTADPAERARRRAAELGSDDAQAVQRDLAERDERDSGHGRTTLEPAPGAVPLDTTGLSVDDVVAEIVARVGAVRP